MSVAALEPSLADLVTRARAGDVDAYGRLVERTQAMAYGAARAILRDPALAEDAAQDAFLRAYRRLAELQEPAAFVAWLRRIVVTVALNMRRAHRRTLLRLDDVADAPILDECESSWTELQRQRLAGALLTLSPDERRICDRRYHGGWTTARLARDAHVDEAAMRKRLQRIREKLRKEIEVAEQRQIREGEMNPDFPTRIVELLARPQLSDLPENPIGKTLALFRSAFPEFEEITLPEVVDFAEARKTIGEVAMYLDPIELQRVDDTRILRYDLTLPLLLTVKYERRPLRLTSAGKAYRLCQIDALHLDAFHQAEVLWMDERAHVDAWRATARVLHAVDLVLPGRTMKIVPTKYEMCSQSWELEIEVDDRWYEVLAWGVFSEKVVRHLGGDPGRHTAIGIGCGLERLAMLRYGIDDIRKIEGSLVA